MSNCTICYVSDTSGSWDATVYMNSEVQDELYLPTKMCKRCAKIFAYHYSAYARPRYGEAKKPLEELINRMQEYLEEHNLDYNEYQ